MIQLLKLTDVLKRIILLQRGFEKHQLEVCALIANHYIYITFSKDQASQNASKEHCSFVLQTIYSIHLYSHIYIYISFVLYGSEVKLRISDRALTHLHTHLSKFSSAVVNMSSIVLEHTKMFFLNCTLCLSSHLKWTCIAQSQILNQIQRGLNVQWI